jgi:hypothetical protein
LEIRVQSTRDKDSSDEERKSLSQVNKATRNTVSATFDKSALDTSYQSFIDGRIELSLEDPFKSHTSDTMDVNDSLYHSNKINNQKKEKKR